MAGSTSTITANSTEDLVPEFVPPKHLFSDYIEITYLAFVICAGLALNIWVLKRLLRERRHAQRCNKSMSGFLLLKLNLNVSDILILLIHASGKFGWLITYEWRGGDFLCRLFNFLSMFTLYLSSNIVICIALDRLLTVLKARRIDLGQRKHNTVRLMTLLAWTLSIFCSIPQFFVWTTYNPFKDTISQSWVQCTDIWSIDRYERHLSTQSSQNSTNAIVDDDHESSNNTSWSHFILQPMIQNTYELNHLFLVFYGPLFALVFCYAVISIRLIRFMANNPSSSLAAPNMSKNVNHNRQPIGICDGTERRHLLMLKRASVKSFPSVRLYSPMTNGQRRKSQMVDIVEVSTKAEEPSNNRTPTATAEANNQKRHRQMEETQSLQNIRIFCKDDGEKRSQCRSDQLSLLAVHPVGNSFSVCSLPLCCAINSPSVLPPATAVDDLGRHNRQHSHCPSSSFCSTNSSTIINLKQFNQSLYQHRKNPRRILIRIRNSFRESFKKKNIRRSRLAGPKLAKNLNCSSVSSLCENGHGLTVMEDQNGCLADHTKKSSWGNVKAVPLLHCIGSAKRRTNSTNSCWGCRCWCRCNTDQQNSIGMTSSSPTQPKSVEHTEMNGHHFATSSNPPTPLSRGDHKSSWTCRAHSAPSASVPALQRNIVDASCASASALPQQQLLRRRHHHLRSKAFRTTLLVILVHILLWSPYNVYALMKHVNEELYERMSEKANVLKDLQFLITLINPFLYGFGRIRAK